MPSAQKHDNGFRVKISDYGMLRELETRGFATPHCYSTLAHLAPEVLLKGHVSKVRKRRPPERMSSLQSVLKPACHTSARMQIVTPGDIWLLSCGRRTAKACCPDMLRCRVGAQAGDVYAFGVLLWELAAGQAMFAGMPWAQVMAAVTLRHSRPRLPPGRALPSGLEPVVRMCMAMSPADRPSFHDVRLAPPAKSVIVFRFLSFTTFTLN